MLALGKKDQVVFDIFSLNLDFVKTSPSYVKSPFNSQRLSYLETEKLGCP